jgi:hypothetical protein
MRAVGNTALSGIGAAGMLLDLPGSMIRDVASWVPGGTAAQNPFDQVIDPFGSRADTNRVEGRQLLRNSGMVGKRDTWGNFVGGLALEMAIDPTTYLGVGAVGKVGKAFEATGLLGGSTRKQLMKEMAETAGKKGFKPGSSWKYQLTGKRVLDHLATTRENAAKAAGEQLSGKRKGKVFNSADELGDAMDDSWAVVDEGGEYKVYRHKVPEGQEKGKWGFDEEATDVFRQKLPQASSYITYNRAMEVAKNAYEKRYGEGFEAAIENDPLYSLMSVRVPFTNLNKPLVAAKNPNEWWDQRMQRAPGETPPPATGAAPGGTTPPSPKPKTGPKPKDPNTTTGEAPVQNAAPSEDVPVDAESIVKDGQVGATPVITPDMLAKLKEAQFEDDEIAKMSYEEAVEALDDGVGMGMPGQTPKAPIATDVPEVTPAKTPPTPVGDNLSPFDAVKVALKVDEATPRGQRVKELFDTIGDKETLTNVPVMDAAMETLAKAQGVTTDEMWGRISFARFADEAELNKAIEEAGGEDKLFQFKSADAPQPNPSALGVTLTKDSNSLVALFDKSNASTVMHEFSHISRKYMPENLQAQARSGVEKLLKKSALDDKGKWTTEAEEAFARAWERYLRDGETKVKGLRSVFKQMREMFRSVYASIVGRNLDINKDLKETFDKLLGWKEPAKKAKAAAQSPPPSLANTADAAKAVDNVDSMASASTGGVAQNLEDALPPRQSAADEFLNRAKGRPRAVEDYTLQPPLIGPGGQRMLFAVGGSRGRTAGGELDEAIPPKYMPGQMELPLEEAPARATPVADEFADLTLDAYNKIEDPEVKRRAYQSIKDENGVYFGGVKINPTRHKAEIEDYLNSEYSSTQSKLARARAMEAAGEPVEKAVRELLGSDASPRNYSQLADFFTNKANDIASSDLAKATDWKAPKNVSAPPSPPLKAADNLIQKAQPTPETPRDNLSPSPLQAKAKLPLNALLERDLPGAMAAALRRVQSGDAVESGMEMARSVLDDVLRPARIQIPEATKEALLQKIAQSKNYEPLIKQADVVAAKRAADDLDVAPIIDEPVKPVAAGATNTIVDQDFVDMADRVTSGMEGFADIVKSGTLFEISKKVDLAKQLAEDPGLAQKMIAENPKAEKQVQSAIELAKKMAEDPEAAKKGLMAQIGIIARRQLSEAYKQEGRTGIFGAKPGELNRMKDTITKEGNVVSAVDNMAASVTDRALEVDGWRKKLDEFAPYLPEREQKILAIRLAPVAEGTKKPSIAKMAKELGLSVANFKLLWTGVQRKLKALDGYDVDLEVKAQQLDEAGADPAAIAEI